MASRAPGHPCRPRFGTSSPSITQRVRRWPLLGSSWTTLIGRRPHISLSIRFQMWSDSMMCVSASMIPTIPPPAGTRIRSMILRLFPGASQPDLAMPRGVMRRMA